jgi:hypothetical protein
MRRCGPEHISHHNYSIVRGASSGSRVGIVPRSSLESGDQKDLSVNRVKEPWAIRNLCAIIPQAYLTASL